MLFRSTSQPNLGSIVEALRYSPRDTGIDPAALRSISMYWEQVRKNYLAFESDIRSGASESIHTTCRARRIGSAAATSAAR